MVGDGGPVEGVVESGLTTQGPHKVGGVVTHQSRLQAQGNTTETSSQSLSGVREVGDMHVDDMWHACGQHVTCV